MARSDRIKWDQKYEKRDPSEIAEPSPFLLSLTDQLPAQGRALDLAGGRARHGLWLAQRGLDVTVIDISPKGLALAQQRADALGVSIKTLELDLEESLPQGTWDVITSFYYLQRDLFKAFSTMLNPGGLLVFAQQTHTNLERYPSPSGRFLLNNGELPGLVQDLEILSCSEAWRETGRHEAQLLARKPARAPHAP